MRELPAAYVAEHVEHAYALTGHGMQGGTVEQARRRRLTPGSHRRLELHRALPRPRTDATLDLRRTSSRASAASSRPQSRPPTAARSDLLARVQRRMLERDDEDLAIEQLPGAGRADDPELAGSRALAAELAAGARRRTRRARAAGRGEPGAAAGAARARRAAAGAASGRCRSRELQRIEDLDERALTLINPARAARRAARAAARADDGDSDASRTPTPSSAPI